MSQNGFIIKNVMRGILLGVLILMGWMFYPEISSLVDSSVPGVNEKIEIVKEKVSQKFPIPMEKKDNPQLKVRLNIDEGGINPEPPEHKTAEDKAGPKKETQMEEKTLLPFWRFDERLTAEDFKATLEKRTGLELQLGQEGYRYVVYIPALNEEEGRLKVDLIMKETGLTRK